MITTHFVKKLLVSAAVSSTLLGLAPAQDSLSSGELLLNRPLDNWIEGYATQAIISPEGSSVLFRGDPESLQLYSLKDQHDLRRELLGSLDTIEDATFCGSGLSTLARLGNRKSETGWFLPQAQPGPALPADSTLVCSQDGGASATFTPGIETGKLVVRAFGSTHSLDIIGRPVSMLFSADDQLFYNLALQADGRGVLSRIDVHTGESKALINDLDASKGGGSMALAADGKKMYIALASATAPNNETRHQPRADRWLKIYRVDLSTGARQPIIESPGQDNASPTIVGDNLYWVRDVVHASIETVPIIGGAAKRVIAGGQLPIWNPSGSEISYFFGDMRVTDIPLNVDDAVIKVDGEGRGISKPDVIVSGYHEDFPPAWSPDGRWIAFHSHRSPTAVASYSSPGSTDDIYLRKADDSHAPEIRLTNFGEFTGPVFWSPDGRKLLFVSFDRRGKPGIFKVFVLTINTDDGTVLKTEMLPISTSIRSPRWAAWSPNGKEIALEDDRGNRKRILWTIRSDGSDAQRVYDYEGTTFDGVDWTHNGRILIFSKLVADHLQLFSISRDGGIPKQLTHDSANLMHPRVSPDGSRIACTRIEQSRQIWRKPVPN